jgi:hypothetical protein
MLGWFIVPDPNRLGAFDANLFQYVGSVPVSRTDPTGQGWVVVVARGVVAIVVVAAWVLDWDLEDLTFQEARYVVRRRAS